MTLNRRDSAIHIQKYVLPVWGMRGGGVSNDLTSTLRDLSKRVIDFPLGGSQGDSEIHY